ncbi:hypothetical protein IAT38_003742 [Cryptococcus sp. DSM 104549]
MATITFQDEPLPSPVTSSCTGHTRTISSSTYEPSRSGSTDGLFAHPAPPPPNINSKSFWSAKARREKRFVRGAEENDPVNPPSRPTRTTPPAHTSESPAQPPAAPPPLPTTPPASTPPLPASSAGAPGASPTGSASLQSSPSTSTTSTLSSAGSPASASSEVDLERQQEKPLTKPKKGRRYGFRRSAGGGGAKNVKKGKKKGKGGKEVVAARKYSEKGDSVSLIHMTGIGVSVLVMIGLGVLLYFVIKKDDSTIPR